MREEIAAARQQQPGHGVREPQHPPAPDRVEQAPEDHRSSHVAGGERENVPAHVIGPHPVEVRQHQRVGEEDGVVEEGLRGHETEGHQRALPLQQQGACHLDQGGVTARAQADAGKGWRRQYVALPAEARLQTLHDGLGLVGTAVRDQPARAFRDPQAHEEDHEAQGGAGEKGHAPADIAAEHGRIEQDNGARRTQRSADPEGAVDDEIGPAAHPARDQLLDRGVDGGVFPTDAGARQESEENEAPQVPRERGRRRGHQVDGERDEEQLLAPEPVGQPAEEDRPQHRACEVGTAGEPHVRVGKVQRRAFLQRTGDGPCQRHLETVEDPGDAQRHHDKRMKPSPRQAVEPRRDVRHDDRGRRSGLECCRGHGHPQRRPSRSVPCCSAHAKSRVLHAGHIRVPEWVIDLHQIAVRQ